MSSEVIFTKQNLDDCLKRLAKEFRRLNGTKIPAEIILVGGAAVLANYGFREMTYDMDAIIRTASSMKEAINRVGDEMGLANGWLNSDFMKTKSYSPKLVQYSKYYKTFYNVLEVRTVSGAYLIAMKLMSGRKYKNDISDIVGILHEEKKRGSLLELGAVKKAVCDLYGTWENLPQDSRELITEVMKEGQLEALYKKIRKDELSTKDMLIDFEEAYPDVVNMDNADEIIRKLKQRQRPH